MSVCIGEDAELDNPAETNMSASQRHLETFALHEVEKDLDKLPLLARMPSNSSSDSDDSIIVEPDFDKEDADFGEMDVDTESDTDSEPDKISWATGILFQQKCVQYILDPPLEIEIPKPVEVAVRSQSAGELPQKEFVSIVVRDLKTIPQDYKRPLYCSTKEGADTAKKEEPQFAQQIQRSINQNIYRSPNWVEYLPPIRRKLNANNWRLYIPQKSSPLARHLATIMETEGLLEPTAIARLKAVPHRKCRSLARKEKKPKEKQIYSNDAERRWTK
ncbi:hypothetical protein BDZ91DRAFT_851491 [Kalaharituber pfeilii]|nr:hypothetical protein BDZ91DRAFT_851491 [Kalaharituber pfeilii]